MNSYRIYIHIWLSYCVYFTINYFSCVVFFFAGIDKKDDKKKKGDKGDKKDKKGDKKADKKDKKADKGDKEYVYLNNNKKYIELI